MLQSCECAFVFCCSERICQQQEAVPGLSPEMFMTTRLRKTPFVKGSQGTVHWSSRTLAKPVLHFSTLTINFHSSHIQTKYGVTLNRYKFFALFHAADQILLSDLISVCRYLYINVFGYSLKHIGMLILIVFAYAQLQNCKKKNIYKSFILYYLSFILY